MNSAIVLTQDALLLHVQAVYKSYGNIKALDNINLSIAPGEFVALLGPNGAGKTTLFQLLTGLFVADKGNIEVAGFNMRKHATRALARIGVVFQQPTLDLDLSVKGNLLFHSRLYGLTATQSKQNIQRELQRLGLAELQKKPIRHLSGGNQRKVELARALLHNPRILFMDEATLGLDPASRLSLVNEVRNLCLERQVAVLWATHLVDEVVHADRVLVLHRGRLLTEDTPEALIRQTGTANLQSAFLALTGGKAYATRN